MALMVVVLFVGDHPKLFGSYRQQTVHLGTAHTDEAALRTLVAERLKTLGITDARQAGRLVGDVMKTHKGQVEAGDVEAADAVEGGAVGDGGADDRKGQRDVDAGVETERLDGDVALVVRSTDVSGRTARLRVASANSLRLGVSSVAPR